MNRVFRFRLYPTERQQAALGEMLADHCDLYNAALQERRDAYRKRGKTVRYGEQSAQLKAIRQDPQYARWSFTSQQQTLRRLDTAFKAFFARIKRGDTPGYPRFRSKRRFDTVTFVHGDGGAWLEDQARVRMQGVGHVKVKLHRPVRGTVKQFSVTRQGRRWFVNVICVDIPQQVRPLTGAIVGLDRGITHLVADSDGGFVAPTPATFNSPPNGWRTHSRSWPAKSEDRTVGAKLPSGSQGCIARSLTPGGTTCTRPAAAWSTPMT